VWVVFHSRHQSRPQGILDHVHDDRLGCLVVSDDVLVGVRLPESLLEPLRVVVPGQLLGPTDEGEEVGSVVRPDHNKMDMVGHVAEGKNFKALLPRGAQKLQRNERDGAVVREVTLPTMCDERQEIPKRTEIVEVLKMAWAPRDHEA
jgi:hypothetical protein